MSQYGYIGRVVILYARTAACQKYLMGSAFYDKRFVCLRVIQGNV